MKRYALLILTLGLIWTCKPLEPKVIVTPPTSISLSALIADDLSEDGTSLSTQNDEIVLFAIRERNQEIQSEYLAGELLFNDSIRQHKLSSTFNELLPAERLSFFLIEIDQSAWDPSHVQLCRAWIAAPGFPEKFDFMRADTLLGDDDLLGMKSFLVEDAMDCSELTFKGRQLFDRYQYRLELSCR